ncbi:MAG: phosphotransferase, partial [Actinomycetota bacterium]|nr:phosphotransferase [Actinomycetota bacterium]
MEQASSFAGRELRIPRLDAAAAADIARTSFGVDGAVTQLGSHQDQNFLLVAEGSVRYVLKVANPAFTRDELDLQNRAMEHTAFRVRDPVPVALPGVDGEDVVAVQHQGAAYHVRLLTYLAGSPLVEAGYLAAGVLRAAGGLAARVAAALSSFDHPALDRMLQWDVRRAAAVVAAYAPLTQDDQRRRVAEHTVTWAVAKLERLDASLRRQAIHGDVTDWNVLAERDGAGRPTPCGLIDFGDMTRSWLAAECAVLAAAMVS